MQVKARPLEVELVGDARGEEIQARAEQLRVAADLVAAGEFLERAAVGADVVQEVGVDAAAGEHADRTAVAARIAAGVLECFPGAFEEHALLRIGELGLARVHAEEIGVELVDVRKQRTGAARSSARGAPRR